MSASLTLARLAQLGLRLNFGYPGYGEQFVTGDSALADLNISLSNSQKSRQELQQSLISLIVDRWRG